MQESPAQINAKTLTEDEVQNYLANNPDFFIHHSDVLSQMKLPSDSLGNVTGFHDFQVKKLKNKILHLEERNRLLIQTSLSNHKSEREINQLVINLFSAGSKEQLQKVLSTQLKEQMNLDNVVLSLGDSISSFDSDNSVQLRTLSSPSEREIHSDLSEEIKSDALIHLELEGLSFGVLILGSADAGRFHAGQGTEILEFLGQVLSLCLLKLDDS